MILLVHFAITTCPSLQYKLETVDFISRVHSPESFHLLDSFHCSVVVNGVLTSVLLNDIKFGTVDGAANIECGNIVLTFASDRGWEIDNQHQLHVVLCAILLVVTKIFARQA